MFNFSKNVEYTVEPKASFHRAAKRQLKALAKELGLAVGTYDVRSNMGGIAVSGEVTLHSESLYVDVSQSCMGPNMGILIRSCRGRKDYTGGRNNFAPLDLLNDIPALAERIRRTVPESFS